QKRFGFIEHLDTQRALAADWVFVPGMEITRPWMPAAYRPLAQWLRRAAAQGSLITSVGTGSFLLAEAGLLDGGEAVTYPRHEEFFSACYPHIALRRDIHWVRGPGVLLSGDLPWQELLLAVISQLWGEQ